MEHALKEEKAIIKDEASNSSDFQLLKSKLIMYHGIMEHKARVSQQELNLAITLKLQQLLEQSGTKAKDLQL